jgi:hypothetical protein
MLGRHLVQLREPARSPAEVPLRPSTQANLAHASHSLHIRVEGAHLGLTRNSWQVEAFLRARLVPIRIAPVKAE